MDFGQKIKNLRTSKGMSQAALAKAAGLSTKTVSSYENGRVMPQSKQTYTKLSKALGVEESLLIDDKAEFVLQAAGSYGRRGARQAKEIMEEIAGMWAGGEMEEEDMDAIMRAVQEAYWEAKEANRKYVNKRFLDNGAKIKK